METNTWIKPTESELEILQVLWAKERATVREVHVALSKFKDAGYTTTLKLMQIMNEKGLVIRDDRHKTHVYQAAIDKNKTRLQLLGKMTETLFEGNTASLIMHALGTATPSAEELLEIRAILDRLK